MSLSSGHEVQELEGEQKARQSKHFPPLGKMGLIKLNPGGWILPAPFQKYADSIYNFEVRPTDVFLVTYPKVGTTWTQEILWTMKFNPDLNHPDQFKPMDDRSPFLDVDMFFPSEVPDETEGALETGNAEKCPVKDLGVGKTVKKAAALPDPRVIKCHLPLSLMPPSLLDVAKVVYVVRNPSDVVTSYCHHCRLFSDMNYTGTLDEFCELFMKDELVYSPYWLHAKEAFDKRHHPNLLILTYEDMKADVLKEFRKLNEFLGTKLTQTQLENISKHTSFDAMKTRPIFGFALDENSKFVDAEVLKKDGGFFRQGVTGDGKKKLSPEMQERMKDWTKKFFDFGLHYN